MTLDRDHFSLAPGVDHVVSTFGGLVLRSMATSLAAVIVTCAGALAEGLPFTEHPVSMDALEARAVFAADVNGDGNTDLLSASIADGKVAWYQSDGGSPPQFTEHVLAEGEHLGQAWSVFAADVDLDGDTDILSTATGGEIGEVVFWFDNSGAAVPVFTARIVTGAVDGPASVFAADVDGDGDTDVLTASRNDDTIAWHENNGEVPPSFSSEAIWTKADVAESVFAADLDGDGDTDVLSASSGDDTIMWFENDGGESPTFLEHEIPFPADMAMSVFAVDMDGDGDVDILSASAGDDTIGFYDNVGGDPPIFDQRFVSTTAAGAQSVYAADVDGDGDADVLSASFDDDTIAWYENIGGSPPMFEECVISTTVAGATDVLAADIDGDGHTDVVSAASLDTTVAWYENGSPAPGDTGFVERIISSGPDGAPPPPGSSSVALPGVPPPGPVFAADLDGDGDIDTLSDWAWHENDGGSPPAFADHQIPFGTSLFAADINGDGHVDVVAGDEFDDTIAWFENDGTADPAFMRHELTDMAGAPRSVFATDLDRDGDLDILYASFDGDTIEGFENMGPPVFAPRTIATGLDGATSVFAADIDGNGFPDVVTASALDDTIAWYQDGVEFTEWIISTDADGAQSVYAADLDGDGDTDVLSASELDDRISWYVNDGQPVPTFSERVISTTAVGARSVVAADVNGDGALDVIAAGTDAVDNKTVWYENDGGDPPTFREHFISEFCFSLSVYPADLDRDADIDLVLGAHWENLGSVWYENGRSDVTFEDPMEFAAAAEATIQAVGNLDTEYGAGPGLDTPDVVVLIPRLDRPLLPGLLQVFRNPAGKGLLDSNEAIGTGRRPTGVAAGHLNDDLYLDVAVSNAAGDNVFVFLNDRSGSGTFQDRTSVALGGGAAPAAIAAAELDGNAGVDLAVANAGLGTVVILGNDGNGNFSIDLPAIQAGQGLGRLLPDDFDKNKFCDLVLTNRLENEVGTVRVLFLVNGKLASEEIIEVGNMPSDIATGDLDRDGFADIVCTNQEDGTLSVIRNTGNGAFAVVATLETGPDPTSVDLADLDGDLDLDIAVTAEDPEIGPAVQVFENVSRGSAAPLGGIDDLLFALPAGYRVLASPNFVAAGDFNLDTVSDLVTANADDGATTGSVTVLLTRRTATPCGPEDLSGNGIIDFADIIVILAAWGSNGGPEDLDGSGTVDFGDILRVLGEWGSCA